MDRESYLREVRADARRRAARSKYRPLEAPYDPKKMVVRIPGGCLLWLAALLGILLWLLSWTF